jgi:four helix bundle protein
MDVESTHRAIKSFEDLEVFKRAYKVSLEVHKKTLEFPKAEQYGLADQLRRASKSICANLAEGFAKQNYSAAEYRRFINMSIASSEEVRVWLRYCLDLDYIPMSQWQRWKDEYQEIAKMLVSLSRSWSKR